MPILSTIVVLSGLTLVAALVWLFVRYFNRREKWARRTAIILTLLLVAYPLSHGPVYSLYMRDYLPFAHAPLLEGVYIPLFALVERSHMQRLFGWYCGLWFMDYPDFGA